MSWPTIRLGDLVSITGGGTPSRSKPSNFGGGIPWVKIGDMAGGVISRTEETISSMGLESSSAKMLPAGTLLLSIFASVGKTALLGVAATTNQAIVGLTPRAESQLDVQFLRHFLDSAVAVLGGRARGVAQVNLNFAILSDVKVPLPPLPEQRRIASILDKADGIRTQRHTALRVVAELADAELEQVLQHAHEIVALGSLVEEFRYGTSVKSGDAQVPVLRIPNVSSRVLDTSAMKHVDLSDAELVRLTLRDGDLLIVRSNGNRDIVGATVRVPRFSTPHVFASYLIRARPLASTNSVFVAKYLASRRGRAALRAGATTSAGQFNINTKTLGALPIALPSKDRQEKFVEAVGRLDALIDQHQAHLQVADALFASLQQRAFAGQL